MVLHVQKFLQNNPKEDLTASLGIAVKQHPRYPELFHFAYDQLESPKADPIVQECRGIILNEQDNWSVVAFPFRRFANQGETWAAPVDWNSVRVQEKVDGSLMILWFHDGRWNVSTKGSPNAGGSVGDFGFTFSELFWETLKQYPTAVFNPHYTYMIELTSTFNRVVCRYGEDASLTLIGVRDITDPDLKELNVYDVNIGIPPVREYPLTSVDEIIKAAEALDPLGQEGYVCVDDSWNRCKIKSPKYVLIHHLRDGMGVRRLIDLIKLGESDEVLAYYNEFKPLHDELVNGINGLVIELEAEYEAIKDMPAQKDFALVAVKSRCSGVLFALRKGVVSNVREGLYKIATDKLEDMIGVRSIRITNPLS